MGNHLNKNDVSKVDRDHTLQPESQAPEKHEYKNPTDEQMAIPSNTSPISGLDIDASQLKRNMLHKNDGDVCDNCYAIHKKAAGKAVDLRLLTLLEFSRQLYVRKQEVFKKSFPELHGEFDELFKKHGAKLSQVKSSRMKIHTVQRSSSVGSSREISQNDLKLERFKIKTIDLGGDVKQGQGDNGNGGQDDKTKTKGGGSK